MDKTEPRSPIDRAKFDVHPDVDSHFTKRVFTPRMRRMVDAYVRHGTYAAASKASGYGHATVKRYIEENPAVRKAVGDLIDQAAILSGVTLERVLQEYARLAFVDIADVIDVLKASDDPSEALDMLADLPADVTAAVSEINITSTTRETDAGPVTQGNVKLKMYDKRSALNDLGRMLSLFNDKLTIEDKSGFGDRLERAIQHIEALDRREPPQDG